MALNVWTKPSGYSFGTFQERRLFSYALPVIDDPDVSYTLISGKLPGGLRLANSFVVGTPFEVSRVTEFTFCIRANKNQEFSDRTFSITIDGADAPEFVTPAGDLAVGPNQQFFVLDNSFVEYQITAFDNDTSTGQKLTYFIGEDEGRLPPGLVLTESGRITGYVQSTITIRDRDGNGSYDGTLYDAVAYDFAVRSTNGYDSYFYDSVFYDFNVPTSLPRKLNQNYEFVVTVTDGDTYVKRTFKIFVVGDDYFRADNTGSSGLFTADVTYLKSPLWITSSDLGTYRANNYLTFKLDTYDTNSILYQYNLVNADVISITTQVLETDNLAGNNKLTIKSTGPAPAFGQYLTFQNLVFGVNVNTSKVFQISDVDVLPDSFYRLTLTEDLLFNIPDDLELYIGSLSRLPTGMSFDETTADVYGRVPYQPAITETFKFTVIATRLSDGTEIVKSPRVFTVRIIGEIDSTIRWNTNSDLGTINANFVSTLSLNATSTVDNAIVIYELVDGKLPFGLTLGLDGEIVGKTSQYGDPIVYKSNWVADRLYNKNDVVRFNEIFYKASVQNISDEWNQASWELFAFEQQGLTTIEKGNFVIDGGTTTLDRSYTFTVEAKDQYRYSATQRTFTLLVETPNQLVYSNLRVKPFLKLEQRERWRGFIENANVFTPQNIYRTNDPNFGVRLDLSMVVYAGIETKEAAAYISAIGLNHKKKRFFFGDVKTATAIIPGTNTPVYEVVYVEMIDPSEPNGSKLPDRLTGINGKSQEINVNNSNILWTATLDQLAIPAPDSPRPESVITSDSTGYWAGKSRPDTYFPNGISNWRSRIKQIGDSERNYLPLWMRSIQPGQRQELGFRLAVPLCYCKIGTSADIALNIKNYIQTTDFNFDQIDYFIDRYIIDSVEGNTSDKYLIFKNDRITV
jgi:hypothetical protein